MEPDTDSDPFVPFGALSESEDHLKLDAMNIVLPAIMNMTIKTRAVFIQYFD
jgi:hypothetical protein